ncbi:MAG: hypothetical protein WA872_03080 [Candidatus Sulfotelmatobacter sp.]
MQEQEFFTVSEVAKMLKVSPDRTSLPIVTESLVGKRPIKVAAIHSSIGMSPTKANPV